MIGWHGGRCRAAQPCSWRDARRQGWTQCSTTELFTGGANRWTAWLVHTDGMASLSVDTSGFGGADWWETRRRGPTPPTWMILLLRTCVTVQRTDSSTVGRSCRHEADRHFREPILTDESQWKLVCWGPAGGHQCDCPIRWSVAGEVCVDPALAIGCRGLDPSKMLTEAWEAA